MKKKLVWGLVGLLFFSLIINFASAGICSSNIISVKNNVCNGEFVDIVVNGTYYLDANEIIWCASNFGWVDLNIDLWEEDSGLDDYIAGVSTQFKASESPIFCEYVRYEYTFNKDIGYLAGGIEGDTIELFADIEIINGPENQNCITLVETVDIINGQCSSGSCCNPSTCNFESSSQKCAEDVYPDYGCIGGTSLGDDVWVQHQDRYCTGASSSCDGNLQWDNTWSVWDNCNPDEVCVPGNPSCQSTTCTSNSDCGTDDWLSNKYCNSNDVWDTYRTYTCNDPGQPTSFCSHVDNNQMKYDCGAETCVNGLCGSVQCYNDADCIPDSWVGDPWCQTGDVWRDWRTRRCANPGQLDSYCWNDDDAQLKETCPDTCANGACATGAAGFLWYSDYAGKDIDIVTTDGEIVDELELTGSGGLTGMAWDGTYLWVAEKVGSAVDDKIHKLTAKGDLIETINVATKWIADITWDGSNLWVVDSDSFNGKIYKITSTGTIIDTINLSGTRAWAAGLTWDGNYLWLSDYSSGIFKYTTTGTQVEVVPGYYGYFDIPDIYGLAWDGAYLWGTDFNTHEVYKIDINDGSIVSEFPSSLYFAKGLTWQPLTEVIECYFESNCGTDTLVGDLYCSTDDIYQDFRDWTCNNPAAYNSACTQIDTSQKVEECGEDNCTLWRNNYCKNEDVYHDRICYDRGCLSSSCFGNVYADEELVENCTVTCRNGSCSGVLCYTDTECGENTITNHYCNGSTVWETHKNYTCYNPGTVSSYCDSLDYNESVLTCDNSCQSGACVENGYLWLVNNYQDKIHKMTTNGSIIKSIDTPNISPQGLTWDGTYLWHADDFANKIYQLTTNGDIISSFDSPGPDSSGLTWDGTYLWHADSSQDKIYKLTTTGTVVDSFNIPGTNPSDLTWDGTYLWHADPSQRRIYKLTTTGTVVDSFLTPTILEEGLTWDGNYLWVADDGQEKVYKLMTDGTILYSFDHSNGWLYGLAWQPKSEEIECYFESDCGDDGLFGDPWCSSWGNDVYQKSRDYTCYNAGTNSSYCNYTEIEILKDSCSTEETCYNGSCMIVICSKDLDCGMDKWIGQPYCNGDWVWQYWKNHKCNNPGTDDSYCTHTENQAVKHPCSDSCLNGACINIECYSDDECGNNKWMGNRYCKNEDVYQEYKRYKCYNDGTNSSYCDSSINEKRRKDCDSSCSEGVCVDSSSINCYNNADCGTDGYVGSSYCYAADVWQTYKMYSCNNPGTSNSYCSYSDDEQIADDCADGIADCLAGACHNISCTVDSDCGNDYWVGDPYCMAYNVYQEFRDMSCTFNSCSYTDIITLKEDCVDTCSNGICVDDTGTGSGEADLEVSYFTVQYPDNPIAGNPVTLAFNLQNIGNITLDDIEWELTTGSGSIIRGFVNNIDAGKGRIISRKTTYSASGTYYAYAIVDPNSKITENNKDNNQEDLIVVIS
ncbi:MAG: CARDB domain-containing protein [Candidatus Woesearchaeota archaeon]